MQQIQNLEQALNEMIEKCGLQSESLTQSDQLESSPNQINLEDYLQLLQQKYKSLLSLYEKESEENFMLRQYNVQLKSKHADLVQNTILSSPLKQSAAKTNEKPNAQLQQFQNIDKQIYDAELEIKQKLQVQIEKQSQIDELVGITKEQEQLIDEHKTLLEQVSQEIQGKEQELIAKQQYGDELKLQVVGVNQQSDSFKKELQLYNENIIQLNQKQQINEQDKKSVSNIIAVNEQKLLQTTNLKNKLKAEIEKVNKELDMIRLNNQQVENINKKIHDQIISNDYQIAGLKRLQADNENLEQDLNKLSKINALSTSIEHNQEPIIGNSQGEQLKKSNEKFTKVKKSDIESMKNVKMQTIQKQQQAINELENQEKFQLLQISTLQQQINQFQKEIQVYSQDLESQQ